MRNHMSAATPDSRKPKTNAGCLARLIKAATDGVNPPAWVMPVFMSKFAIAMQTAVSSNKPKPKKVNRKASVIGPRFMQTYHRRRALPNKPRSYVSTDLTLLRRTCDNHQRASEWN